ncbi:MAG: DUF899 family protein [Candidatus Zixiibacteriota bacterium]
MSNNVNAAAQIEMEKAIEEISKYRAKIRELRKSLPPEEIGQYQFTDGNGNKVSLSSLFGNKKDLIIVHNMGKGCPYCTLWADGFNGVYQHLENRAGFAVVSPDKPETMKEFSRGRNWKFRILSNAKGNFTKDMGYEDEKGNPHPGISTFHRDSDGKIYRISHAPFGPGDDFCAVWYMFDMLQGGANGWQPKYMY